MDASALLTLAGLQLLIAVSPGPASVLTIKTAAADGWQRGVAIALGLALAIVLWASAALAGLAVIFEIAPWLQTGLRIVGGLFLVWIGITLWRHADQPMPTAATGPSRSHASSLRLGIYTNLANPKALAYFAAVFVGLLPTEYGMRDAFIVLAIVFAVESLWYVALALVFSRPAPRRAYAAAKSWLDRIFGGLVGLLGARIAATQ